MLLFLSADQQKENLLTVLKQFLRLHGEDEEAAEGAESALVKDATRGPEEDLQPVPLLQDQRHAVRAAAVEAQRVVDGKHVLAVFHHGCVQGTRVSHVAGEPDVVESFHRSSEDSCRSDKQLHTSAVMMQKIREEIHFRT